VNREFPSEGLQLGVEHTDSICEVSTADDRKRTEDGFGHCYVFVG
jgi:hypothetical protein